MKLFNVILFRIFKGCNCEVLKAWYGRNKKKIEENFYQNDILMSGVIKEREGEVLEVLYLKYYAEEKLKSDRILDIYSIGQKDFPEYIDFTKFFQNQQDKDIINQILRKIIYASKPRVLSEEEYVSECLKVKKFFVSPFVESVKVHKKVEVDKENVKQEIIAENELAFIGIYSVCIADTFEEMLIYKILEKLFGANDINGIYHEFRERGWIYTGLSAFIIDKNCFYSGTIMQYSREREEEIIEKIKNICFSSEEFDSAKKLVLDDYKYSVFQYGVEFTLLPYKLQTEEVTEFVTCLETINISDVMRKIHQIQTDGQRLRLKVM